MIKVNLSRDPIRNWTNIGIGMKKVMMSHAMVIDAVALQN
jgi:hypothetical protein